MALVPEYVMAKSQAYDQARADGHDGEEAVLAALRNYGFSLREAVARMRAEDGSSHKSNRAWFMAAARGRFKVGRKRRINVWNSGLRHHNARLSPRQIREIMALKNVKKETGPKVAARYKVSDSTIYGVWNGQTHLAETGIRPKMRRKKGPNPRKGEKHPAAKLTRKDVKEIVSRREKGESLNEIAADYPVVAGTIHSITTGRSWLHVTGLSDP